MSDLCSEVELALFPSNASQYMKLISFCFN